MTLANGHASSVNALALTGDGRVLASGGDDGLVCLWDPDRRSLCARLRCRGDGDGEAAAAPVAALAFADDWQPRRLYAAQGCHLLAWDTRVSGGGGSSRREPLLRVRVTEDEEVNGLAILSSGSNGQRCLATVDDGGCVRVFDAETGEPLRALRKHESIASSVLFRPGRDWQVISGGMDCRLVVTDWQGSRGQALNIFDISEILDPDLCGDAPAASAAAALAPPLIHCLAATPDGGYVAAGLENGSVELFNASGRHLRHAESLYGHAAGVSALLCLPGRLLLSGGNDADCYLWNLDSDWSGGSFAHADKVNALCGRSPDRVYLADSGSAVHCCDLNVAQLQQPQQPQQQQQHFAAAAATAASGVILYDDDDEDEEEDDDEDASDADDTVDDHNAANAEES